MATRITNSRILDMRILALSGITSIPNSHSHALFFGSGSAGVINVEFKYNPGTFILIEVTEYMTAHLELLNINQTGTTFPGTIYIMKME